MRTVVVTEELARKLWDLETFIEEQSQRVRYARVDLDTAKEKLQKGELHLLELRRSRDHEMMEVRRLYAIDPLEPIDLADRTKRTIRIGASDSDSRGERP